MSARAMDETSMHVNDIVCGCADLSVGRFRMERASHPEESFDGLLTRIGAGKSCTACLLDLEYLYTSTSAHGGTTDTKDLLRRGPEPKRTVKQRVYDFLDGLGPQVPYPLEGVAPILIGAGIEQRLTIASHSLNFEGQIAAPPIVHDVSIYDAEGKPRGRHRNRIEAGESWRLRLTDAFPEAARASDVLAVGLMKVKWRFCAPGMRGNARPQIEINAQSGSCAVHTQRAGGALDRQGTLISRPTAQRLFLTIVNPTRRVTNGYFQYPFLGDDGAATAPQTHRVQVAAKGASIHEIVLDGEMASCFMGKPMIVRAVMNNPGHKMHVLYTAPDLSRISIDHL